MLLPPRCRFCQLYPFLSLLRPKQLQRAMQAPAPLVPPPPPPPQAHLLLLSLTSLHAVVAGMLGLLMVCMEPLLRLVKCCAALLYAVALMPSPPPCCGSAESYGCAIEPRKI